MKYLSTKDNLNRSHEITFEHEFYPFGLMHF